MFTPHTFTLPTLTGIGAKNIEEHLKLYAGYVTNANLILEKIQTLSTDPANTYMIGELRRRFGFEYNGMRNHEYYFTELEGGARQLDSSSSLAQQINTQWGSYEAWLAEFTTLAMTRGVGWAMLYYDPQEKILVHAWIDEQHLGQLIGLTPILALDMWEHSYVYDYPTSEKKKYVEAFFANVNWSVVAQRHNV